MKYDVIIIGGGPIGLFLGALLGKKNIKTLIIEKEFSKSTGSKAIGITPPSLKILKYLGLDKDFIKNGVKVEKAVVHGTKNVLGRIEFKGIKSEYKYILSIPQMATESILEKNIGKYKSVVLKKGFEAVSIEMKSDQLEVKAVNRKSKKKENFFGNFISACDGKNSFVRNFLKKDFKGGRYKDTFLMADFIDKSGFKTDAHLFFTSFGPVESFPLPGGMRRWIIGTKEYMKDPPKDFLEKEVLRIAGIDLKGSKKLSESPFGVQHNIIDSYYHEERFFFCGDAAHLMSPIGGQGMNTGFADAELCGNVILSLMKKKNFEILQSFNKYRRKAGITAINRAALSMNVGTIKGKFFSLLRNIIVYIFIRITGGLIPNLFSMLTIPYGTSDKINKKDF